MSAILGGHPGLIDAGKDPDRSFRPDHPRLSGCSATRPGLLATMMEPGGLSCHRLDHRFTQVRIAISRGRFRIGIVRPCHGFRRAWATLRYDVRREVNTEGDPPAVVRRRPSDQGAQSTQAGGGVLGPADRG